MSYKYSLIISQYYHTRHMFIVSVKENFVEQAKKFAYELMRYKRSEARAQLEMTAGDLDYIKDTKIRSRYNINDSGDIYFIQSQYANRLMNVSFEYQETSRLQSVGFKSKRVLSEIEQHHNYGKVKEILEKHFEIV